MHMGIRHSNTGSAKDLPDYLTYIAIFLDRVYHVPDYVSTCVQQRVGQLWLEEALLLVMDLPM